MKIAKYTKSLTIVLEEEIYNHIKQISEERETSMGEIVREIVDTHFKQNKKL